MTWSDTLWARADRIFERALELEGADRRAFLATECGDTPELRALVDRLLAAAEETSDGLAPGGALGGHLGLSLGRELGSEAPDPVGTVIGGRYRVMRELGRGGMAVVYLAERAGDDFHQLVALKLLQPGLDHGHVVQRFHLERQILALARHPNIARLYDAGVAGDGRPYLAMEYVEGQPIDRYCDQRRLSVQQRLRLFIKVAQAVDYAHRNLVVHRDIKPSNILVTPDGDVKLLDFGIAKLLDDSSDELTRTHMRAMTPAFASPEQITGQPITTATDVYQLGLLLYILLTGCWPYPGGRRSDAAVMLAICNQPPGRPSSRVGRRGTAEPFAGGRVISVEEVASERDTTAKRLRRELSGDLDTIVLTALRKEPERRYGSVAQMVGDVVRHLDGRTISARRDTFAYRAWTFARRHAVATATAAAALILVAGLLVVHTVQIGRERDHARLEARKATEVARFLEGLFEVSAPTRSLGEQVTARELLDRGAERIDVELDGQPRIQARMMALIGNVYRELALYDEARRLLEGAVEIQRRDPGEDRLEVAASLFSLGKVLERTREPGPARAALEEALAIREPVLGREHPDVARVRDALGQVEAIDGNLDVAGDLHAEAARVLQAALGENHPDLGMALNRLAVVRQEQRAYPESIRLFDRAIAILESSLGPEHPYTAAAKFNLAHSLRYSGRVERADRLYSEVLPLIEKVYGPDHPNVAVVLNNHANLLREVGRFDDAEALLRRAHEIFSSALGPEHPQVGWALNNLGLVERERGDHAAARDYFERSVEVAEAAYGPDHADVATQLKNLAEEMHATGESDAAIGLMERAIAIRERVYGPDHSYVGAAARELAVIHLDRGDPAVAEPLLRRALATGRDDPDHHLEDITDTVVLLAGCLVAQGRADEASALLEHERSHGAEEARRVDAAAAELGLGGAGVTSPGRGAP